MDNFGNKMVTVVAGGLIAYVVCTLFTTSVITGTTTVDTMVKTVAPLAVAGGVVIAILKVAF